MPARRIKSLENSKRVSPMHREHRSKKARKNTFATHRKKKTHERVRANEMDWEIKRVLDENK